MNPALPEFPRIMQDPSTESVARACRARGRAGIPEAVRGDSEILTRRSAGFQNLFVGEKILRIWGIRTAFWVGNRRMRNESADSVQSVLEFPVFMHQFSEAAGLTHSPLQWLEPTGDSPVGSSR